MFSKTLRGLHWPLRRLLRFVIWLAIDVIVKKLGSRNEADRCNVYLTGLGHAVTFLFACFFPCMLVMSSNTFGSTGNSEGSM